MKINLSKTVSFETNNLGNTKILGPILNTSKEIQERMRKENTMAIKYHKYLTSQKIKLKIRIRISITYIRSIILYNCSIWTPVEEVFKRIEAFERKRLRKLFRVLYPNRMTNNELMKQSDFENIREIIDKRRWSYLGHILRRPNLPMSTELENGLYGERKKGRPRKNMATVVRNDLNKKGLEFGGSEKSGSKQKKLEKFSLQNNGKIRS